MRYFFYGTLMDIDVLRAVIGTDVAMEPAVLRGWRRVGVRGEDYPIIIRDMSSRVDGVLVRGLDERAAARLASYEGAEYVLIKSAVFCRGRTIAVNVFAPRPGRLLKTENGWNFEAWRRRHKRRWIVALERWQRRALTVSSFRD